MSDDLARYLIFLGLSLLGMWKARVVRAPRGGHGAASEYWGPVVIFWFFGLGAVVCAVLALSEVLPL